MESIAREIYAAVVQRGYREGWTAEQFAARQVAKLAEELGELIGCIHAGSKERVWEWLALRGAAIAREVFDESTWKHAEIEDPYSAIEELADIVVVCCCLAEALMEFEPDLQVDLLELALQKAKRDRSRGVR